MTETKRCPQCDHLLPVTEFYPTKNSRDGFGSYCRPCGRAYSAQRRRSQGANPRPAKRLLAPGETKECRSCHRVLDVSEFYPSTKYGDGRRNFCSTCDRARSQEWQSTNRARKNEIQRDYAARKKQQRQQ